MRKSVVGLVLATLAAGQLACGRSWPNVRGVSDRGFAGGEIPVARIDILPVDVIVDGREDLDIPRDELQSIFDASAEGALLHGLAKGGYQVGGVVDWNGNFAGYDGKLYAAMPSAQLMATTDSLASYGTAQETSREGGLLVPYLPARLGQVTGSDATLYIGGWAYSGKDTSTGEKVGKGILIAVTVIAIVAIVALLVASKGKGGGGGGGLGAVGKAAGGAARVAGRAVGGAARVAGRGLLRATHAMARGGLRTLDAFGRMHTHVNIYIEAGPRHAVQVPTGGPSKMLLEMTLVDNRSGRVLWHARQQFRANPAKHGDVVEAVLRMLRSMPART